MSTYLKMVIFITELGELSESEGDYVVATELLAEIVLVCIFSSFLTLSVHLEHCCSKCVDVFEAFMTLKPW
jgi:hypothetical protein